jgi:hypothetical protein
MGIGGCGCSSDCVTAREVNDVKGDISGTFSATSVGVATRWRRSEVDGIGGSLEAVTITSGSKSSPQPSCNYSFTPIPCGEGRIGLKLGWNSIARYMFTTQMNQVSHCGAIWYWSKIHETNTADSQWCRSWMGDNDRCSLFLVKKCD